MKKIIALVLAMMMVVCVFAACSKDGEGEETKATDTKATDTKATDTKAEETKANETVADDTDAKETEPEEDVVKNEIKYATPQIDGKIDDAYLSSAIYTLPTSIVWNAANVTDTADHTAKTYFLWDENYIYVACEVTDPKVQSRGQDYFKPLTTTVLTNPSGYNPYKNDCVEHWFLYDDDIICKVSCDAKGYGFYTMPQDGGGMGKNPGEIFDIANSTKAVSETANGYIIELALKLNGDKLTENKAGVEVKYGLQVNDINNAAAGNNDEANLIANDGLTDNKAIGLCCYGVQKPAEIFVLAEKD